jgi:hypothetical protein
MLGRAGSTSLNVMLDMAGLKVWLTMRWEGIPCGGIHPTSWLATKVGRLWSFIVRLGSIVIELETMRLVLDAAMASCW